jgi:hypothetical protein
MTLPCDFGDAPSLTDGRVVPDARSGVRYQARRQVDAPLRQPLNSLAQERWRFGYRRLNVPLRREGHDMGLTCHRLALVIKGK